ncbi:hypothetical protein [Mycolicibacterium parafortuitum]|uniref:hypothetical protein n=1 Tax=Mycolicibacterium parafortuitum TaxID=39692 RepID=UPI001056A6DD|nr:hypothetical protein [Mycolicibacterium parafortuitum]
MAYAFSESRHRSGFLAAELRQKRRPAALESAHPLSGSYFERYRYVSDARARCIYFGRLTEFTDVDLHPLDVEQSAEF